MHVINDLRYAARGFLRNPGFAVAFILTLGLGIGANTAIFSVINGVLLQPLPYQDGDRVVVLRQPVAQAGIRNMTFSVSEIVDLRTESEKMQGFAEYSNWVFTVLGRGEPHRVAAAVVSANYFDVVGLEVQHGRAFIPADDDLGADPVAIVTQQYWAQVFAADPAAVGQTINVDGTLLTIVGVLEIAPEYAGTRDIYINTTGSDHHRSAMMTHSRTHRMTQVFARLAPGATVEEAQTELTQLKNRLHAEYPEAYPKEQGYDMAVALLRDEITREARPTLLILLSTAGFVLIIACANAEATTASCSLLTANGHRSLVTGHSPTSPLHTAPSRRNLPCSTRLIARRHSLQ